MIYCCCSVTKSVSFATSWTVAHQAPLSMGFPRQEYWSVLPLLLQGIFPNRNQTCVSCIGRWILDHWATREAQDDMCVLVIQLCPTLCDPMDGSPLGSSVHEILQARILEWVAILFSRRSAWTRGLYPGLLHCRQILYHLSHQGSPCPVICPLSNQVICFCCWVITLYIFWILIPYQIDNLQIFSPSL